MLLAPAETVHLAACREQPRWEGRVCDWRSDSGGHWRCGQDGPCWQSSWTLTRWDAEGRAGICCPRQPPTGFPGVCACASASRCRPGAGGARAAAWGARGGQELHLLLRLFLSLGPPWHSRHGLSQGFLLHISLVWFPNTSSVCFPDWFVDLNEEKPSWRKYQCPNTKQHVILCKSVAFAWFDRHDDKARWMHV